MVVRKRKSDSYGSGYTKKPRYSGAAYRAKSRALPSFMSRNKYMRGSNYTVGTKEMKFTDFAISSPSAIAATTGAPGLQLITQINQGTDYDQRIGRIVNLQSLEYSYDIRVDFAANAYTTTKVAIVYDKQVNGVLPSYSDVYINSNPHARKNVNNEDRFIILHEEVIGQAAGETASVPGSLWNASCTKKGYIKLKGMKTLFSGTTGAIGSHDSGAIYVIAANDNAAHSFITGYFRIRFWD